MKTYATVTVETEHGLLVIQNLPMYVRTSESKPESLHHG